ncbi:recombination regulator RecX [Bacillus sp. 31A1R]|uniref:Regulatory protein RecX n=1 Tax=Robertmurraya mangrovi TaxID=3098077 RepID=A0ABU5J565_9BACI|nr:recombination regulator RecX [Bacillus sp. 31A1R]MDZ5474564.1 recombination regulator RecX [Bacillus sp. 31A1R]
MAIITKITVQKLKKDRYNIFLDYGKGEEYAFSVDEDVLIKNNLKKGLELDELFLSEITYQDDIRKAYNQSIQYLSRMMRTEKEIRTFLRGKELPEPVIQEVIHKLYEYKFLNDEDYAYSYVRTQMNTSDKGIDLIKRELREKGVQDQLIEKAIGEYPVEAQIETAKKLCEKYVQKYNRDSDRVIKQKLEQMLLRKGYHSHIINIAMEEVEIEKEQDEEMAALIYQGEKLQRKYSKFTGYEYEQKMKQALYRKGFSIDLIERFLRDQEDI